MGETIVCPRCKTSMPAYTLNVQFDGICPNCQQEAVSKRPAAESIKALPMETLGKYKLLSELGRGGMGVVYEAVDTALSRKVALKLMIPGAGTDPAEAALERERFVREARVCANLPRHPFIVSVYDTGVVDGKHYLAMEFISGKPMSSWRRDASLTMPQQVALLKDVLEAMHHAHENGVVHRDLKPQNVLVDEKQKPHVVDFGLAKSVGKGTSLSLTASGTLMGTPNYMSPEQANGEKNIDGRTDVWAAGVMLYEILTGQLPFSGDTAIQLLMNVVNKPLPPPSSVITPGTRRSLDKKIEKICMKALVKERDGRYATAGHFAQDLGKWLKGEEVAVDVEWPATRRASSNRKPVLWIVAALVLAVLGLGAWQRRPHRPRPAPERDASAKLDVERRRLEEDRKALEEKSRQDAEAAAAERKRLEQERAALAEQARLSGEKAKKEAEEKAAALVEADRKALEEKEKKEAEEKARAEAKRKELEAEAKRKAEAAIVKPPSSAPSSAPEVKAPPLPPPANPEVNVLSRLDSGQDAVTGSWGYDGKSLVSPREGGPYYYRLPYEPPEEYDLAFTLERRSGTVLAIKLCSGATPFTITLDKVGTASGLELLDGRPVESNESFRRGAVFTNRKPAAVKCSVRKGRVTVTVEGRAVVDWSGDFKRLSSAASWAPSNPRAMHLGTFDSEYVFTSISVTPVSGPGRTLR